MDTFFVASKLFWLLAAPSNFSVMLAVLGVVFLIIGWRRFAIGLFCTSALALAVLGFSPVGNYLFSPLEERFPQFHDDGRPVAGIIQRAGGLDSMAHPGSTSIDLRNAALAADGLDAIEV